MSVLPPRSWPFKAAMAASAASAVSIVTKPKPRLSRVCGSYMIAARSTFGCGHLVLVDYGDMNMLEGESPCHIWRKPPRARGCQSCGRVQRHGGCFQDCSHRRPCSSSSLSTKGKAGEKIFFPRASYKERLAVRADHHRCLRLGRDAQGCDCGARVHALVRGRRPARRPASRGHLLPRLHLLRWRPLHHWCYWQQRYAAERASGRCWPRRCQ